MTCYTLTILEVTGIQEYIFSSNELAQNIGASELVFRSTTDWVVNTLNTMRLRHNAVWEETGLKLLNKTIDELDVELVYAGGGNCLLLFKSPEVSSNFIRQHTRSILIDAPGLQMVACSRAYDKDTESLSSTLTVLRREVAARKFNLHASTPLSLSVSANCVYSGKPAVGFHTDPSLVGMEYANRARRRSEPARLISSEVASRLCWADRGKDRLHRILHDQVRGKGLEFVYDFDEIGSPGEFSYLAVVHLDVNGMGRRFEKLAENYADPSDNRTYLESIRALSENLEKQSDHALNVVVGGLLETLKHRDIFDKVCQRNERIPFRPIVFGGDDITFVCDGRLGLPLAAVFLEALQDKPLFDGKPAVACAGVAIVHTHYPFSRAYELAEALTDNAKRQVNDLKRADEETIPVIDWHFSTTGMLLDLHQIREREYTVPSGRLYMRPVHLQTDGKTPNTWHTWGTFTDLVAHFQKEPYADQRNKLKALRDALREGEAAVFRFRKNYRIAQLPEIKGLPTMMERGWQGEECGYFDALEAADFFIPIAHPVAEGRES